MFSPISGFLIGSLAGPALAQSAGSPLSQRRVAAGARDPATPYQTLYVDPDGGDDTATGVQNQPLRTVTHALAIAPPNTVIVLAPGRYTQSTGEVFPLQLKPGVTIQGGPGSRDRTAIIEGGGNFTSPTRSQQNATILAADRAGIAQVAISNPDGYGVWIESASPTILESAFIGSRQTGIYVASGSPRIQSSYFSGNQVAGLIVFGLSSASIQSNIFDGTGDAIQVMEGATPEIIGNRMTNNDAAVVLVGSARPILRDNQMTGNRRNDVVEVAAGTRDISPSAAADVAAANPPETAIAVEGPLIARAESAAVDQPVSLPVLQTGAQSIAPPVVAIAAQPVVSRPVVSRPVVSQPVVSQLVVTPEADLPSVGEAVEADAAENLPLAGAPGSALLAIRSGITTPAPQALSSGNVGSAIVAPAPSPPPSNDPEPAARPDLSALRSRLALSPRAVSGENANSPVLGPDNQDATPAAEPAPAIRPAPVNNLPEIPVNNNRLAVPSSQIPIGSGSSITVFSPPSGGTGLSYAPSSRAQALGLYYRVFVEATDPYIQDDVRSIVADAFRTNFEGRTVMQVGAFLTEVEAEDRRQLLEDYNFDARVEYLP
ncbi:DUF1565 domain-containing protein [Leptolyngbya sp. BC1307]|uniref:DUF1565 domain-containing protein n=1 Tax=Leptolyngbya sp. BC1307 TaxID=2029589 RepID=UPI001482299C|nr:DUF1565 domain-containing protein [Leptolyngbya sp. BC1307]